MWVSSRVKVCAIEQASFSTAQPGCRGICEEKMKQKWDRLQRASPAAFGWAEE
jgi:hypothetical protein